MQQIGLKIRDIDAVNTLKFELLVKKCIKPLNKNYSFLN